MDIFYYRVFLTIVKYNSFQKAAELHNVTPPAISHIVKQLEQAFGFSLFVRNRRGVVLTAAGESIKERIQDIVQQEDRLFQIVTHLNGMEQGHIKIGIFNSMCAYLPDIIKQFQKIYPKITFEIFQGSYEDIIEWIKNGTIEIGFLSKTVNPGLPFYKIFSDPLVCILEKNSPFATDADIQLEDLSGYPFVMQRESCDADARRIMHKLNLDVQTTCHVVDDITTVEMVKAGFGFAIMPQLTMRGFEQEVCMRKIIPNEEREIGVTVKNERHLSPAVKMCLDFIMDYFED